MTGKAEPQISAILRDGTSDWGILNLAWVGKGGKIMCFGVL